MDESAWQSPGVAPDPHFLNFSYDDVSMHTPVPLTLSPEHSSSASPHHALPKPQEPLAQARKRKAPTLRDSDWEPHKERIIELHITENLPLQQVIGILKREHDFEATVRQYRARISKWGLDKNVKKDEMHFIVQKQLQWKLDNPDKRDLHIELRGVRVNSEKIERWKARTGFVPIETASVPNTPEDLNYWTASEVGSIVGSPVPRPAQLESPHVADGTPISHIDTNSPPTFRTNQLSPSLFKYPFVYKPSGLHHASLQPDNLETSYSLPAFTPPSDEKNLSNYQFNPGTPLLIRYNMDELIGHLNLLDTVFGQPEVPSLSELTGAEATTTRYLGDLVETESISSNKTEVQPEPPTLVDAGSPMMDVEGLSNGAEFREETTSVSRENQAGKNNNVDDGWTNAPELHRLELCSSGSDGSYLGESKSTPVRQSHSPHRQTGYNAQELEIKLAALELAQQKVMIENKQLQRRIEMLKTENEIRRAFMPTAADSSKIGGKPARVAGPTSYHPTEIYSNVLRNQAKSTPGRRIATANSSERLLAAGAVWDLITSHEQFKRGLVDIGDVCERLKNVAKWDGIGPVFEERAILQAIQLSVEELL
ncbi:hypothetical protein B0T25DRAFT_192108 [Lasiosphaeria hispida]|uniref:Clr5 domain-containing protein n=1 Tax=Lasiosphaeria hispida TaxID=260671 RepID=A0AAJ0HHF0_9PEZI|nr:hypothetical protein B0T25DRAFT_192108 [Lasiosphaeria hispida]